ncbi:MAG: sigma 54-interacting transcriptional regulator [Deltaproteobacteria bacterium]|nr:sigma 54-interacting transcriptional regulator [Deltaproteobacteria bacterium]
MPSKEPGRLLVIGPDDVVVYPLPSSGVLSIGRSPDADVRVDDPSVSRMHAILRVLAFDGGAPRLVFRDLGSSNGTFLRGARLSPGTSLDVSFGDVIEMGQSTLLLRPGRDRGSANALPAFGDERIVVEDPKMLDLFKLVRRVAASEISVLILGETGVGKEVVAKSIHSASERSTGPFVALNCGALPEALLESELFGHERGAFTGAVSAKRGLLEIASGGTIFLDEISEMPLSTQVKLLRVFEERALRRVGGLESRPLDLRVVAATNRDLEREVEEGTFRQDLFYRLNGISIHVPPLRERPMDLEGLVQTFAAAYRAREGLGDDSAVPPEVMACLRGYVWPGNVRELKNVVERAVVLAGPRPISIEHLPVEKLASSTLPPRGHSVGSSGSEGDTVARGPSPLASPCAASALAPLSSELGAFERQRIVDALEACGGNQTRAAAMLGMSRKQLIHRLDRHGIVRPRKKPRPPRRG